MNIKSIISIFVFGVIFSSCTSIGKIQLEILRPPTDTLSISNQTINITNGYLQKNVKSKDDFENLVKYDKYRLDSLVSVESIIALRQTLNEAGMVKTGVVDSTGQKKIGGTYLSIDSVNIRSEVETEPMYVYSRNAYYAAVRVPYIIKWRIQAANEDPVYQVYQDTLWAEGYAAVFDRLADLVSFDNVIEYIISKTTFDFARKISPVWEETTRYYMKSGNNDFLRASFFMDNKQYDEAALIWQKYAENDKGTLAASANLNLALYHELQGDINEAIIFCEKAVELKNELAKRYLKVLKQRQYEIQKILKIQ